MRQVTGRSSNNSENKASIRLASGGRFFSASSLGSIPENEDVIVCIDTPRVTLVPQSLTNNISADSALAITGQRVEDSEIAIYSEPHDDMCAAIAISKECYQNLVDLYSSRLKLTTPLLSTTRSSERSLALEIAGNICYIRLYDNGLKLAEAIEVASAAELVFYITNILNISGVPTTIPIYIIGTKEYVKALKKYYKVICE